MSIVGIDLGATNSLISCFRDGRPELIKNVHGEVLTPSVVSMLENGEIIVGRAAKERLYTHPHLTAAVFKRFMGTKKQYALGTYVFTPVELSCLVLKSLKADAEAALGEKAEEAIISIPAYFNEQQRRATKQAGEMAGFRVEHLISEPTAAALAYGLHQHEGDQQFMVFDLGGGTFDVSIIDLFENILEVKAIAGDSQLGGEDFDQAIADYFIKKQNMQDLNTKAQSVIREKAETVKCALSASESAEMRVVLDDKEYSMTITQEIFKEISEPILARVAQPVTRALDDTKLKPSDLSRVIMAGGSSRMPLIHSFAERLFGQLPLIYINPDETIALGAGVAAALNAHNSEELEEHMMTDVCPFTLGTACQKENIYGGKDNNVYLSVIERNSIIPCSKTVLMCNGTAFENEFTVEVFQGEGRKANQNLKLGKLSINIPPKPKYEARVEVRFTYDENGLLEVELKCLETGETKCEIVINPDNQLTQDEINNAMKHLEEIKIHPREEQENALLLARAGRLYEELLDERDEINTHIGTYETSLEAQDPNQIKKARLEFAEYLDKAERQLLVPPGHS